MVNMRTNVALCGAAILWGFSFVATIPIGVAILSPLFLKKQPGLFGWLGVFISFIGIVILVLLAVFLTHLNPHPKDASPEPY